MLKTPKFVTFLIGEYNDLIDWKSRIIQRDLETKQKRRYSVTGCYDDDEKEQKNENGELPWHHRDFRIQRRFSTNNVLQRSATDSAVNNQSIKPPPDITEQSTGKRIIKIKRSRSQKIFEKKINRLRRDAIGNRIEEQETEFDDEFPEESCCNGYEPKIETKEITFENGTIIEDVPVVIEEKIPTILEEPETELPELEQEISEIQENQPEPNDELPESETKEEIDEILDSKIELPSESIPPSPPPPESEEKELKEIEIVQIEPEQEEEPIPNGIEIEIESEQEETEEIVRNGDVKEEEPEIEPEEPEIEPEEPEEIVYPRYNVLLEKMTNTFRHQFEMKTFTGGGSTSSPVTKKSSVPVPTHCYCGEPFNFSEKYLRCFSCLSACHTGCGSTMLPKPCIRYVDAFLKPSKSVANFVFPRWKPAVPALLINLCREIESRTCSSSSYSTTTKRRSIGSTFEMYYVKTEIMKPVKDQCKRLLQQAKLGYQRLDGANLDHLCGMVKYFLSDICDPVFPQASWKEYAIHIQKRTEDDLRQNLLEHTFPELPVANLHTLCFMLLHLKHLNKCQVQDLSLLAEVFCPVLLGELESRRKLRLMQIMLNIDVRELLSFIGQEC